MKELSAFQILRRDAESSTFFLISILFLICNTSKYVLKLRGIKFLKRYYFLSQGFVRFDS